MGSTYIGCISQCRIVGWALLTGASCRCALQQKPVNLCRQPIDCHCIYLRCMTHCQIVYNAPHHMS